MSNIQLKNVPEDLHEQLRSRAAAEHRTIRDYVLQLLVDDLSRPTTAVWLDELAGDEAVALSEPVAETVAASRRERDAELDARSSPARHG